MCEPESDSDVVDDERSMDVFRYQAHEMFYSVIWNIEDKHVSSSELVDIAAREELWLAKVGAWTEALAVYEEKLQRNSNDFEAVVGCMRCLSANGEWRKVLELANHNWSTISGTFDMESTHQNSNLSSVSQRKAVRMCAQAAWRLGQWGELERYASQLVHGTEQTLATSTLGSSSSERSLPLIDFDGAFYGAVLHVHRMEWADAANMIDAARRAMDGRLTALMSESYNRAYPSMVTAQNLAELEEIVEFRMLEETVSSTALRHPTNRHSVVEARKNLLSVWRKRLAGCRVDAEVHSSILALRSLVLGPTDEVDSILTLSELSRQSQRYKFAERVLLDSLEGLHANLNGPVFGFRGSEQLRIQVDFTSLHTNSLPAIIDTIISGDLSTITPSYGPPHEQLSKSLVDSAGGLDRYVPFDLCFDS
jgi:serine/threonine-protein kinase mTOR